MARKQIPKLYDKPRQCGGKNCYPTKLQAEAVKLEKEIMQPELELATYRCIQCRSWHLTRNIDVM